MKRNVKLLLIPAVATLSLTTSCNRSQLMARDIEGRWESSSVELTLPPDTAGLASSITMTPVITFVRNPDDIGGYFVMQTNVHGAQPFSATVRGTWAVIEHDKILIAPDPDAIETTLTGIDPEIARRSIMALDAISGIEIADGTMTGRVSGRDITMTRAIELVSQEPHQEPS